MKEINEERKVNNQINEERKVNSQINEERKVNSQINDERKVNNQINDKRKVNNQPPKPKVIIKSDIEKAAKARRLFEKIKLREMEEINKRNLNPP